MALFIQYLPIFVPIFSRNGYLAQRLLLTAIIDNYKTLGDAWPLLGQSGSQELGRNRHGVLTDRPERQMSTPSSEKSKKRLSEKGHLMISTKDMLNTLIGTKHFKKSIAGIRKSDKPFVDLHRYLIVYPDSMKNPQNFSPTAN